jgi:hypothetical protein
MAKHYRELQQLHLSVSNSASSSLGAITSGVQVPKGPFFTVLGRHGPLKQEELESLDLKVSVTAAHLLFMDPERMMAVIKVIHFRSWKLLESGRLYSLNLVQPEKSSSSTELTIKGPVSPFQQALEVGNGEAAARLLGLGCFLSHKSFAQKLMNEPWLDHVHGPVAKYLLQLPRRRWDSLIFLTRENPDPDSRDFLERCADCALPEGATPTTDPAKMTGDVEKVVRRFFAALCDYSSRHSGSRVLQERLRRICVRALCNGRYKFFRLLKDLIVNSEEGLKLEFTDADYLELQIAVCAQGFVELANFKPLSGKPILDQNAVKEFFVAPYRRYGAASSRDKDGGLKQYKRALLAYLPDLINQEDSKDSDKLQIASCQLLHIAIHHKPMVQKLVEQYKVSPNVLVDIDDKNRTRMRPVEFALALDADETAAYFIGLGEDTVLFKERYLEERFKRLRKDLAKIADIMLRPDKKDNLRLDVYKMTPELVAKMGATSKALNAYIPALKSTKKLDVLLNVLKRQVDKRNTVIDLVNEGLQKLQGRNEGRKCVEALKSVVGLLKTELKSLDAAAEDIVEVNTDLSKVEMVNNS